MVYGWVMERKWIVFMIRMVYYVRRFWGFEGGKEYMIYFYIFVFRIWSLYLGNRMDDNFLIIIYNFFGKLFELVKMILNNGMCIYMKEF